MSTAMDFTSPAGTQIFADGGGSLLAAIRANMAAQATWFQGSTFTGLIDGTIRLDATGTKLQKSLSGTFSDMPLTNILGFTAAPISSPNFSGTPQIAGSNIATVGTLGLYALLASPTFSGTVAGANLNFSGTGAFGGLLTLTSGLTVSAGATSLQAASATSFSTVGQIKSTLVGSGPSSGLAVITSATGASIGLGDTSQTTDSKYWDIFQSGLTLNMRASNDANNAWTTWASVTRSGYSISNIALTAGTITLNGNGVTISGTSSGAVPLTITSSVSSGYNGGIQMIYNNGVSYWSKLQRVNPTNGSWELVNNALSAVVVTMSDAGAITAASNVAGYGSDERLKKNWQRIEPGNAWRVLKGIGGFSFDWDAEKCAEVGFQPVATREHGYSAQKVRELFPEASAEMLLPGNSDREQPYLTVMREKLSPLQNVALLDLHQRVRLLEART